MKKGLFVFIALLVILSCKKQKSVHNTKYNELSNPSEKKYYQSQNIIQIIQKLKILKDQKNQLLEILKLTQLIFLVYG